MLDQYAGVLDHRQPRGAPFFRRRVILDAELQPYDFRAHADRAFYDRRNFLRPPENIHDVYFLLNVLQPRITLLSQHFRLIRVHGNDTEVLGEKSYARLEDV